jgi:hypothetical protein
MMGRTKGDEQKSEMLASGPDTPDPDQRALKGVGKPLMPDYRTIVSDSIGHQNSTGRSLYADL